MPAPKRGELVRRIRRAGARAQGAARAAGLHRDRQDPAGRAGRSAGSDRHLRLRRGPVAPAARLDHRQRAPRASHDGDLAPARASGSDQRFQLPGGGMGVERGARAGVRRHRAVEAFGEDAADRASHAGAAGACLQRRRQALPDDLNQIVMGGAEQAACCSIARRCAWYRPPVPRAWGARWPRRWRPASCAPSSSWAATMRQSWRRLPIWRWPSAASCSPPWEPRDSAALRCAG